MEKAWCNGSSEIAILSVQQMENSKNITPELARKAISSYKSEIAKMEKELELRHQAKLFELQKKISIRNQVRTKPDKIKPGKNKKQMRKNTVKNKNQIKQVRTKTSSEQKSGKKIQARSKKQR